MRKKKIGGCFGIRHLLAGIVALIFCMPANAQPNEQTPAPTADQESVIEGAAYVRTSLILGRNAEIVREIMSGARMSEGLNLKNIDENFYKEMKPEDIFSFFIRGTYPMVFSDNVDDVTFIFFNPFCQDFVAIDAHRDSVTGKYHHVNYFVSTAEQIDKLVKGSAGGQSQLSIKNFFDKIRSINIGHENFSSVKNRILSDKNLVEVASARLYLPLSQLSNLEDGERRFILNLGRNNSINSIMGGSVKGTPIDPSEQLMPIWIDGEPTNRETVFADAKTPDTLVIIHTATGNGKTSLIKQEIASVSRDN
ncbi:MAG: hypothetical protein P4M05_36330 [Bradyrhizobium sp.]|nr:hypothetical protein [Bradyrhizobium sp.]